MLIDNFKKDWWKLWSVRLNVIGATMLSAFLAWPDMLLSLWNSLPEELKVFVPSRLLVGLPLVFFIAATVARFVKQEKLNDKPTDG